MSRKKKSIIKQIFEGFMPSKPPDSAELKKQVLAIERDQRKFRRDLGFQDEIKDSMIRKAVRAKKNGRKEEALDLFRDIKGVELEKAYLSKDLRQLSLSKMAVKAMLRKVEMLERRNDSKSIINLVERFNDSRITAMIEEATVDESTFEGVLHDIIGEAEDELTAHGHPVDVGFEDFWKGLEDLDEDSLYEEKMNQENESLTLSGKKNIKI